MQRQLALKGFLESQGFRIFLEELNLFYKDAENRVINKSSKPVGLEVLNLLNFDIGEKSGLNKVLCILEGYAEELKDKSSSET